VNVFRFVPGYEGEFVDTGKEPLLLLLLAFLITFALTRGYTRIARVRGWGSGSVGGVHLHHVVPGVILALLAGLLAFVLPEEAPYEELLAIVFGAGAALTLDEFALIFRLEDVYWAKEGRTSVDAVVVTILLAALLLLGVAPFGIGSEDVEQLGRTLAFAAVVANAGFAAVAVLKGRLVWALVGVFVPVVAVVVGLRLAKPSSTWARRRYVEGRRGGADKLARAQRRFDPATNRQERLRIRLLDLIGGAPTATPRDPAG
jgi:lysyl-tRNA synthetase class 2